MGLFKFIKKSNYVDRADKAYSRKQYEEALRLYTKAAELGDASIIYKVGKMHLEGIGCKADREVAIQWFQKSAKMKHSASTKMLNKLKNEEDGIAKKTEKKPAAKKSSTKKKETAPVAAPVADATAAKKEEKVEKKTDSASAVKSESKKPVMTKEMLEHYLDDYFTTDLDREIASRSRHVRDAKPKKDTTSNAGSIKKKEEPVAPVEKTNAAAAATTKKKKAEPKKKDSAPVAKPEPKKSIDHAVKEKTINLENSEKLKSARHGWVEDFRYVDQCKYLLDEEQAYYIISAQPIKPGKGSAYWKVICQSMDDDTYREIQLPFAGKSAYFGSRIETEICTIAYKDEEGYYCLRMPDYESCVIPYKRFKNEGNWIVDADDDIEVDFCGDKLFTANPVQKDSFVVESVEASSDNDSKIAILRNGNRISVPKYVREYERISVDTLNRKFLNRD